MGTEKTVNRMLTNIEIGFNIADSLPVISFVSTPLRILAGKVQTLFGLICAVGGAIGKAIFGNTRYWAELKKMGQEQMLQGALNVLRGFGEALLTVMTLSLGNIVLLGLQELSPNGFNPLERYGHHHSCQAY